MTNMVNLEDYKGMDVATAIFGMYLIDHIEGSNVQVLTADMSVASCLERIKLQYPDHYTDVGIAEQNMIGICAGLANEGFRPMAICQATFISMRAFEMDRQLLGYMNSNVVLLGLHAGFFLQFMGNTHYATEDIAIMRTIPGMTILSPADAGEAVMCAKAALEHDGPVYIRLTGGSTAKTVYPETCDFQIGKDIKLREGKDITIFATGAMVGRTLDAAEILSDKYGIDARVYDVHTLKPKDVESIKASKNSKLLVSVEEHSIIGGLGSSISDFTSQEGGYPALLKLGVPDKFSVVGDYDFLLEQHRLTTDMIAKDISIKFNNI